MTLFCLDLDEIEELSQKYREIAYNRFSLFSLRDGDHLPQKAESEKSIKQKAIEFALSRNKDLKIDRVWMVGHLKTWGYVFNPATFFFFYDAAGSLIASMVEVKNTFGETKIYFQASVLKNRSQSEERKFFYISPFSDADADLKIKLSPPGETVKFVVNQKKDGKYFFFSHFYGEKRSITHSNLWKFLFRHMLNSYMVTAQIHYEALKIAFKKVPYFKKNDQADLQKNLYHSPKSEK